MKHIKGEFIDGSAVIYKKENGKLICGLLFENGSIKWYPQYLLGRFRDGISCVVDIQTRDFGYLHRGGDFIVEPKFLSASDFREQHAFAYDGEKLMLIDTQINTVAEFPPHFVAGTFHEGLAIISEFDDESSGEMKTDGYVDACGNIVIPIAYKNRITNPRFHQPEDDCSEGLIRICKGLKYGYIDQGNRLVIPSHYDWASRFNCRIAAVCKNNRYGFINASGDVVLPFNFSGAKQFGNGLAPVKIGDYWGFINPEGEIVIPARFESTSIFYEGTARVVLNSKTGLIDIKGEFIVPPRYDSISFFNAGLCRFFLGGHEGVLDKNGSILMSDFMDHYYLLSKGNISYMN
jgi:hypothetical protein